MTKLRPMRDVFRSYGIVDDRGRHVGGTDKQTNHHYGDAYERLFPDRATVRLMMEVGVADGSSLLAWRDIFPEAICVGLDIHASNRAHGKRIEFHIGDARMHRVCEIVANARQFDFIVDDASHRLEDQLRTMLYLWLYVRPGGLYVVEEFADVGALRRNIKAMWPGAEIADTKGPFGGVEPLVALRKPI